MGNTQINFSVFSTQGLSLTKTSSQRETSTKYVLSRCFAPGKKPCVLHKQILLVITPKQLKKKIEKFDLIFFFLAKI